MYLLGFTISTIRTRRRKRRISSVSITFETHSLFPVSQNFICSSHLKEVRAILKIIRIFWPALFSQTQLCSSTRPNLFHLLLHFQYCREACKLNKPRRWLVCSSSLPQLGFLFVRINPLWYPVNVFTGNETDLWLSKWSEELTSKGQSGIAV